nr:zinc finger C2H2 type [Hymenolepis microstoma]
MTESNNTFPPDASAVFALMKSFGEHQQNQQNQNSMMPMESSDTVEAEELKNRLLAAAMSMLGGSSNNPPAWLTESQIPIPNPKSELGSSWEEMNLTSQFFSGVVTPSSEATTSPPNDFPFPNPFIMLPPGLQSMGGKCMSTFMNGNKDEDFCELCQKHFCNKYYLRKHKNDVHRIPSEPFSQMRKRELGSGESDDNDQGEKSSCTSQSEWINVLTSSAVTAQQLGDNRRTPLEAFRSISNTGEIPSPLEKESFPVWLPKSEQKTSRVELGENATFIPPVVSTESAPTSIPSSVTTSKTLNPGAIDMFKSSMAAAKLADRVTCELCKKELCNKYFLRTHKIKVHGLSPQEVGGPASRSSAAKHNEKVQSECINQNVEPFNLPPPIPPPLSLVNPILPSQFPAPLGTIPPWLSPQPQAMMSEMPKSSLEDQKKDPVMQLMAANALVNCPLCEKTIGPRLFLPTHLTSVHGLSPTDPSFFIFILSARNLDGNNGESDASTNKLTPTSTSERGSPLSTNFQPPNMSIMRLTTTSAMEPMNRDQNQGLQQLSIPNSMNGMLPPSISMSDMGVSSGTTAFDLPLMATAPTTAPLLLPPPLGLLSNPPGIYPGPPTMPQTPAQQPGIMMNPTTITTTKWNPVQLAASGLNTKRVLPNGSASGTTPRKSPNQMRVLCDICNKWICNKYFLRTHKANKHGITDQSNPILTPTSQGILGMSKGPSALPLDFSKPGKTQSSDEHIESSGTQQTIMNPWSFTNPNPHSPDARSPNVLTSNSDSVNPATIQYNSAEVLNLSLKPSALPTSGSEIKHGVDQFLSNFPPPFPLKKRTKLCRHNLRLYKRAVLVLAKACRQLNPIQKRSPSTTNQQLEIECNQHEVRSPAGEHNVSRNWPTSCQVCKASFSKWTQLEAHCCSTGHQRAPNRDSFSSNFFHNFPEAYNLSMETSTVEIPNDCSVEDASNAWWSARQQKWPINFAQGKLNSHQTTGSNTSAAEQYCSYQASHHVIQPPIFNETTTTPTI